MKTYDANRGVQLDSFFSTHAIDCEKCRQFDAQRPATAALMCLEGVVLFKRDHAADRPRSPAPERPETYAPKARMKALMRYKGEE